LHSLKKEIEFYASQYARDRKIISIFFGGGTPSLMQPDYISEIIQSIKKNFHLNDNAEITLETNPGTVDKKKLIDFRESGINRISIGIQSFNDEELKFLTRIHDSKIAISTVNECKECGFDNINIDLIFNLPKQTKEIWRSNLIEAVNLPVNHISAYSLILEHGTILNKMVLDGKVKLQDDDYDADLYEFTIDFLTAHGFAQYEVSNFAQPGFECIHNNTYWHHGDYLGFGTSAHSFAGGKRWWNCSSVKYYNSMIAKNNNAVINQEQLSKNELLEEFVMLSLRSNGLNLLELETKYGNQWYNRNKAFVLKLLDERFLFKVDNRIKLTAKGYAVCDEILAKFEQP
jgi:oxygen-independent coproporphyrinogen-3 oxidase